MSSDGASTLGRTSVGSGDAACSDEFRQLYPEYSKTWRIDVLRLQQYGYLDDHDHVYLDYTGAGLAAKTQREAHQRRLSEHIFGNPHSINPTSQLSTTEVEKTRERVLQHFNASVAEYAVIFTANATAAARLVGEAYPFTRNSRLVLTSDNHNSIVGIREFAKRQKAKTAYVPLREDLRAEPVDVAKILRAHKVSSGGNGRSLFAYPAQSNFSGVRHPLSWVSLAQGLGYHVLLDAAAYVPTSRLDLSRVKPDFVTVSWYKVFGFPTGVGCLIARRDSLALLQRPWFSGGTIRAVTVGVPWHRMETGEASFEDGTLNYLSIPDVKVGLDWIESVGMDEIAIRVRCLTDWFLQHLQSLYHSNGEPMIRIYGPAEAKDRGGTVTFNILDPLGTVVDERVVAKESAEANISLRTGCFCNPGAGERAFNIKRQDIRLLLPSRRFWKRHSHAKDQTFDFEGFIRKLNLPSAGAVRVSFGVASLPRDVEYCVKFIQHMYTDRITERLPLAARQGC